MVLRSRNGKATFLPPLLPIVVRSPWESNSGPLTLEKSVLPKFPKCKKYYCLQLILCLVMLATAATVASLDLPGGLKPPGVPDAPKLPDGVNADKLGDATKNLPNLG